MLVAQAQTLAVPILSVDPTLERYDVEIIAAWAPSARRELLDLAQEPASRQERRQRLAMIGAGQPVLASVGGVDLGVVPAQVEAGCGRTASGGADQAIWACR
jgi:hypothetical protein